LSFFSYLTTADPGTLGFVWSNGLGFVACMGAPVGLSSSCLPVFAIPPQVRADMLSPAIPLDFTTNFPTITLVPPVNTAAPEPSTWAMILAGFVGLGFAGCRRSMKTAAIALLQRYRSSERSGAHA
jgi:PEP-CTERM motif